MKKTVYSILAFLAATLCITLSCTKDTPQEALVDTMPEISFSAYIGGSSSTRTVLLGDNLKPFWSPADEFKVFSGNRSARFVSNNTQPVEDATFTGNLSAGAEVQGYKYWALYPYRESDTFSNGVYSTTLPPSQVAATGTFADDLSIMVAKSNEECSFDFYNVCSGLRFKVDRSGIKKVTLMAKNKNASLAGSFSVDYYSSDSPVITTVSEKFSRVTVTAPAGGFEEGEWYYVMVLPGSLDGGFTVYLEGENGVKGLFFYDKTISFNKSRFRQLTMTERNTWYFTPKTCNIVNDDEAGYIAWAEKVYVDEELDNYTKSIKDYTGSKTNQYPLPVDFTWTGSAKTLVYSTDPTFETSVSTSVSSSPCQIYNLIPGVEYYYKVLSSDGTVIKVGSIIPTGPLRAMYIKEVNNMRDLGGWESALYKRADGNSKTIKYGKIYRGTQKGGKSGSSGPGGGSNSGIVNQYAPSFSTLGITVDIDLRGNGGGSASAQFATEYYNSFKVRQFMVSSSGGFLNTAYLYRQALKSIIDYLKDDQIIYFHCIGGADRTGTLAFIIEALLGVSETYLDIDYELTSFNDTRERTNTGDRPFYTFVQKMKEKYGSDINTAVYKWATEGEYKDENREPNNLEPADIDTLRELMLE